MKNKIIKKYAYKKQRLLQLSDPHQSLKYEQTQYFQAD